MISYDLTFVTNEEEPGIGRMRYSRIELRLTMQNAELMVVHIYDGLIDIGIQLPILVTASM
jgi:hypothetical protein